MKPRGKPGARPKARRGAQPGNCNALKHGFYSSAFKQQEKAVLSRTAAADLSGEIDLVRVTCLRFLEALQQAPGPIDVQTYLAALRLVNLSALSIARMIRVQCFAGLGLELQSLRTYMMLPEAVRLMDEEQARLSPAEQEQLREDLRREQEQRVKAPLLHPDEET